MDETGTKGQKYITVDADMDLAEYFEASCICVGKIVASY